MNLLKISSISFLVFCSLILGSPASAASVPVKNPTSTVIANLNVHETKITSQKGNQINISFNLANGQGTQSGIKYGVSLLKVAADKSQTLADEYVYPEVLSLSANTTTPKNISYEAPSYLNGDYTLYVMVKNDSGLPLGLGLAGKVTFTSSLKTLEILPETCKLSVPGEKANSQYSIAQGIDIATTENLLLTCLTLNSSKDLISATPTYETHYRTVYGQVVEQMGGSLATLAFKAGEKKTITLTLPKATKPQSYDIKVALKIGQTSSNYVTVHYVLRGVSATIQNFSLDKDYYTKNDVATMSFFWSPSADNFPGSRLGFTASPVLLLGSTLKDDKGKDCINPINQTITDTSKAGQINLSAPVTANCQNPQAILMIKDASGNILDQKVLSFETKVDKATKTGSFGSTKTILIIFGILIVAGFAVYFINLKKKENETNQ